MNILMISGDKEIARADSPANVRMQAYAAVLGGLDVVVGVRRRIASFSQGNLTVYPAHSCITLLGRYRMAKTAIRIARAKRMDVVTAQSPDELGLIAYAVSRMCHIPLQLQMHTDMFSPWYRRASWKERLRVRLAKFLLLRADCVRVVSKRIERSLSERLRMKKNTPVSIVPMFTDIRVFVEARLDPRIEERFKDYEFKMIAYGRFMEKEKNFLMLIEVMRNLIKRFPKTMLVILGAGQDQYRYEEAIRCADLGEYVIIEPWRDDLPSFIKSFDLFLLPSYFEGWGRAIIEAMASGLPVVMTDVGLAGEVVRDGVNGRIVPVADTNAFFEAVCDLIAHPEKRIKLANEGTKTVSELQGTQGLYLSEIKKSFISCQLH